MNKLFFLIISFSLLVILSCQHSGNKSNVKKIKYEANWESLSQYECPEWFRDAKLGIYTHWGPYSVPSWENEWYPRLMYISDPASLYLFLKKEQIVRIVRNSELTGNSINYRIVV